MKLERLQQLVRKNISMLAPYSNAREEYKGEATIFLDANENPFGSPVMQAYNRYPDPLQKQLKFQLAKMNAVPDENIFIGNGSDEVIDLLCRIFCEPAKDNIIICPPTYGMYEVCARINDIEVRKVVLNNNFQLKVNEILNTADSNTKLLFICSPNNPTGNSMHREDIIYLLQQFSGLVVMDEAYIDYASQKSFLSELTVYPNLVLMQTLSKAWGLAALRVGLCFASREIILYMNKVKPPYNIGLIAQQMAQEALCKKEWMSQGVNAIVSNRKWLLTQLNKIQIVEKVYESDANFLLIKFKDAGKLYKWLLGKTLVVRNRSHEPLCYNCLRITIGTNEENIELIKLIQQYNEQSNDA